MNSPSEAVGSIATLIGGALPGLIGFLVIAFVILFLVIPVSGLFRGTRSTTRDAETQANLRHRQEAEEGF